MLCAAEAKASEPEDRDQTISPTGLQDFYESDSSLDNTVSVQQTLPYKSTSKSCSTRNKRSIKSQANIKLKGHSIGIQCTLPSDESVFSGKSKSGNSDVSCEVPSDSVDSEDDNDSTYNPNPNSSNTDVSSQDQTPYHEEQKFIVYKSCLLPLFEKCNLCNQFCEVEIGYQMGSFIKIFQKCNHCSLSNEWASQPFVNNMALSAAILFTGLSPTKDIRMLNSANVACHTVGTYHKHARFIFFKWCGLSGWLIKWI